MSSLKLSFKRLLIMHLRQIIFALVVVFAMLSAGCAKPEIITEYKEVAIPLKCQVEFPKKPKFDKDDLQSVKDLAEYYALVEELLKACINE